MRDPFTWQEDGTPGLELELQPSADIRHEVLFEEGMTTVADSAMRVGDPIPRRRIVAAYAISALILGTLAVRTAWIQVHEHDASVVRAEENRLRTVILPARRGLIRDRNGTVLAENVPSFDVHLIRRFIPRNPEERNDMYGALARTLGILIADIEAAVAETDEREEDILLRRDIPYEQAVSVHILASGVPAVEVVVGHKRRYPESDDHPSLSHVLGYVGVIGPDEFAVRRDEGYRRVDVIGITGIESAYEDALRGVPGERRYEVDSRHHVTATVKEREPEDGSDVTLTVDLELQIAAERALQHALDGRDVKRGAAVALDPRDGSILAAVSWPSYDNNLFSGQVSGTAYASLINDENRPLLPRAWAGTYPSGSTIKPVVAVAALEEGIVTPRTTVLSVGGIRIGPWFFPDWKAGGHGPTTVRSAIAWSVNTFFYYVGGGYREFVGLGVDRLSEWFRAFGFGSETGLDVPGERPGFVPSQQWKLETKGERWFIGDTYNLSIGQGDVLVTPLQIARMTAEIANGGYPVTPHFVTSTEFRIPNPKPVASDETIETVRQGMRDTVVYGSGRALAGFPIPVSGKTGTAQWRSDKENHAWFTAFAPFDRPEIVVTVLIEEGEEGSRTALPVARDILWAWHAAREEVH